MIENNYPIRSVKRLIDGEVFCVGDIVSWGVPSGAFTTTITKFEILNNRLFFYDKELFPVINPNDFTQVYNLTKVLTNQTKDTVTDKPVCNCKENRSVPFTLRPALNCKICGLPLACYLV